MPSHHLQTKDGKPPEKSEICLFAQTNFRNQMRAFGIKTDDRRRHMYVIGKTGMGKTTMMENMVLSDIYAGHGVGIVDPHGDFAEKIINFIPSHRINDVVYFNPADVDNPIGFNVFEVHSEEQKHLVASGLMGIFKKIWPDVWSSRMEYILNNTILALLDYPGSTLLGINRLLADAKYRRKVVKQLTDPVVKAFWRDEFANYEPRYAKEAVAPIQNKIGQFLSASVIRNMVAQVKSTINVRDIMDTKKIFIMNLSKGRIGEDNSRLLGGMLITKLQLAAMERVDMSEEERQDFFLYVDEFQNFATPSFANILSEARKYRLSLIMAHQYVKQLDELVADAVFGNVGTIVTFRIGAMDAEALAKEFAPVFLEENIVNLSKYTILLKLMIDGVASRPFSAQTMPPIGSPTGSAEKVIRVSRERYSKTKSSIEEKILKWSGMEYDENGSLDDSDDDDDERPKKFEQKKKEVSKQNNFQQKKKEVKKDGTDQIKIETKIKYNDTTAYKNHKPIQKNDTVINLVEPEESISLSSLLPKEKKVDEVEPHSDRSDFYSQFDGDLKESGSDVSSQTVVTDSFLGKPMPILTSNNSHQNQAVALQGESGKKKKRRRKKKKFVQPYASQSAPLDLRSEPLAQTTSQTPKTDTKPTHLDPDQVVSFDP
ncbi:MAG: type IV secretion system DNA-binding domain-containing protein [Candidatus Magasanikbacteria bacterium]|nr:type IV secretion system DNA-binding domain-containing protein [Candidatus Magasanikbacteria bacterium]